MTEIYVNYLIQGQSWGNKFANVDEFSFQSCEKKLLFPSKGCTFLIRDCYRKVIFFYKLYRSVIPRPCPYEESPKNVEPFRPFDWLERNRVGKTYARRPLIGRIKLNLCGQTTQICLFCARLMGALHNLDI